MAVTAATVSKWSKLNNGQALEGDDLALMELLIAGVTGHVEERYLVADPLTPTQELATIMQCARIWRRRDTPEGVIAFDELGAVRITRLDTDVAAMLSQRIVFS